MNDNHQSVPLVSFIIPTLNAGNILKKYFSALFAQDYPKHRIEVIVADGGSTDDTLSIAKSYGAKIIKNPHVYQEYGKTKASGIAKGALIFYTDSDNILATKTFISDIVKIWKMNPNIMGFIPQTVAPIDSHPINRYLGYLFTEPFTWFVYKNKANPMDFRKTYRPIAEKKGVYELYQFPKNNLPLFGLAQGVATNYLFKRGTFDYADDILSGIKLMNENGLVAYVPKAKIFHYHVNSFFHFIEKYRWRAANNLTHSIKDTGLFSRLPYLSVWQKMRMILFLPYAFSIIFPLIDATLLAFRFKDSVMFLHVPMSFTLASIILFEFISSRFTKVNIGNYK